MLGPLLTSQRLVTLTGTGGIGKTRLACELASKSTAVGGGPYFVDLAPIGDVALVPNAMASALGVARRSTRGRDGDGARSAR